MVIVLAAVAVVSGVRGHSVAGLAASVPAPGPPQPGDCVTSPPPPGGLGDLSAGKYLQLDLRRCAGSRYGEVVAVIANPAAPVQTRQGSETFSTNANSDVCYGATLAFVGVAAKAVIPMPLFTYWSTTVATSIAASTPTPRQRSAGQHWLACVTYLPATGNRQESTVRTYTSSLRNAVATGNQRNYLGLCFESTDWSAGLSPGGCALAHRSEMLGAGQLGNAPTTRADLLHTCSQFLEHRTGRNVTATDGLAVSLYVTDEASAPITTATVPAQAYLGCGVVAVGDRRLAGSLLALGNQPIPWA